MECRNCGRALDDDVRFRPGCGIAVVSSCVACGAALVVARTGEGDVALRQAQAAVADIGYEPLLGSAPETRRVGVSMVTT